MELFCVSREAHLKIFPNKTFPCKGSQKPNQNKTIFLLFQDGESKAYEEEEGEDPRRMEECEVIDPIDIEKETIIARAAVRDMEQGSSGVSGAVEASYR